MNAKLLVCLLCKFCVFNNYSLSYKLNIQYVSSYTICIKLYNMCQVIQYVSSYTICIKLYNMCQVILYCDVINVQPRYNFWNKKIK